MSTTDTKKRIKILVFVVIIILGISFLYVSLNTYLRKAEYERKLLEAYQIEVPSPIITYPISGEYADKIYYEVYSSLTALKKISFSDEKFKNMIEKAEEYLDYANHLMDPWEKLRYTRRAYFLIKAADAYYKAVKNNYSLEDAYNLISSLKKKYDNYRKELLENIYCGENISVTIYRSYILESFIWRFDEWIEKAKKTLNNINTPIPERVSKAIYYAMIAECIITDSLEIRRMLYGNISYNRCFTDCLKETNNILFNNTIQLLDTMIEYSEAKNLEPIINMIKSKIEYAENHYQKQFYSLSLIETLISYTYLKAVETTRINTSINNIDDLLDKILETKKKLVEKLNNKINVCKNDKIKLLLLNEVVENMRNQQEELYKIINSGEEPAKYVEKLQEIYTMYLTYLNYIDKIEDAYLYLIIEVLNSC